MDVLLRPDDIVYAPDSPIKARVASLTFQGAATLYRLQLPTGTQLEALFPSHVDLRAGDQVGFEVSTEHLILFPASGSVPLHHDLAV